MPNDPKSFLSTDGLQTLIANIKASLGTTDYDDLSDKPKLNNVTVQGNKTSTDFGLQDKIDSSHKLNSDLIDDSESINKFVTAAEKTAWNKSVSYMSIPNNGDLNDYYGAENAGNYLCTDANVATLSHKPSAITTAFRMDVIFYNDQTIQVIYPNDEKCISFLRIYKNNTWSEWKESAIEMTILSYGNSTWDDFMKAYLLNSIVYCRAGSSTPQTSPQLRLAFMAYVNDEADPTEVEFQYYRSVSNKSDSAQGDEVYVYKLNKTSGWSNLKRNTYSKVAVASPISKSYASGTVTLSHADSGVTAGTYDSVTVDAKGHVTAGSNYTIDSTPTENSTNLVTSGGVYTDQTRQDTVIDIIENKGAKNLWNITIPDNLPSGFTITRDTDGGYIFNGTAGSSGVICSTNVPFKAATSYVLSGCPSGGSDDSYRLDILRGQNTNYCYGDAVVASGFTATTYPVRIRIAPSYTCSNLKFYPMLCTKAEWDISHEYVPYGKTNAELTQENSAQDAEIAWNVNQGVKNLFDINATSVKYHTTSTLTGGVLSGASNGDWASYNVLVNLPAGDYIFSAVISDFSRDSGAGEGTIRIRITNSISGGTTIGTTNITGNGAISIPFSWSGGQFYVQYSFNFSSTGSYVNTFTASNSMIRPASITDSTFQPYSLPNPTLTPAAIKAVDDGAKNIADFTSATKTTYTTATFHGVTITRNGDIFTISGTSDTNDNAFFNIYYEGSTTTKIIPPGNWVALIENYTGDVVKDIAVQIAAPVVPSVKPYGTPVKFSLSGSESGNWLRVNIRPSTTYNGSFRLMICTAADWAVSQKFVPYCPTNRELYEMIGNINTILQGVL